MTEVSALQACLAVIRRDLTIAFRHRGELANPLLFFLLVVSLFPLGIGPDSKILETIAPGVIWVAALLATLLSLETLFRADLDDGSLEQMVLSPQPLAVLVLARVIAQWLTRGLPLLFLAPLLGILLQLPTAAMGTLMASLALGTPILALIGAIGAALTVGLKRGGVLLSLLVLPLYIPVLIFGAGAVNNAATGLPVTAQLYLLGALLALAITLAPLAAAAALRVSVSAS